MAVESPMTDHVLSVTLPHVVQLEMVTVVVKRDDRVDVVAGVWHVERDCESNILLVFSFMDPHHPGYYEWRICFAAGDVDMSTVRARPGQDGKLFIEVQGRSSGRAAIMDFRHRYS